MILDCVTRSPLIISEQGFLTPRIARVTTVLSLESVSKAKISGVEEFNRTKNKVGLEQG